ncbi:O-methyltransferase [Actinophytocola glycyrrhizae]|uniref:O-methyltransferase n=1 Tax=Actinophytocola glycyrrhizae TaxID=2044873 RepID=A0ABV9RVH4_9PSEU
MRPIPTIDALHDYVLDHSGPVDGAHRNPNRHTSAAGERTQSQIGHDQGTFLTMLTQLMNAERAIEIGTFTGYSALCIARGLPANGRLITCDVSHEWSETAGQAWSREGLSGRIEPRLGPAVETLRALPADPVYDLAFLGADKPGYLDYYEELVPRLRAGGLIVIDEVLLAGTVVTDPDAEAARTMREFNAHVCADKRVDAVMLSIGDGVTLARKRLADDTA